MTSEKQIAANRANAKNSTGPRTEEGKAASSLNAMTHGLTAQRVLLEGEDPVVFEMLRQAMFYEFAPESSYEEQLTHRMATLVWRVRRIPEFESAILSWMSHRQYELFDSDNSGNANPTPGITHFGHHLGLRDTDTDLGPRTREHLKLGRMLAAASRDNLTAKLSRYEAHLMRQLKETRKELEEVQAARVGAEAERAALMNSSVEHSSANAEIREFEDSSDETTIN